MRQILKRILVLPVVLPLMLVGAIGYFLYSICDTFSDPIIKWTDK